MYAKSYEKLLNDKHEKIQKINCHFLNHYYCQLFSLVNESAESGLEITYSNGYGWTFLAQESYLLRHLGVTFDIR